MVIGPLILVVLVAFALGPIGLALATLAAVGILVGTATLLV